VPLSFGTHATAQFDFGVAPKCYSIAAVAGDKIRITTTAGAQFNSVSSYPTTSTELYSPTGTRIASKSFLGGFFASNATSTIESDVLSSGTYKVKLSVSASAFVYVSLSLVNLSPSNVPTANTPAPSRNVALATSGATAIASTTYPFGGGVYNPAVAIDGNRKGGLSYWNDYTIFETPDWLQINFQGEKTINSIEVFSIQDAYTSPAEPNGTMTFSNFGLVDFDVQYFSAISGTWATVPNGSIRNNNLVWRTISFPAVATSNIRVVVLRASDGYTRVVEIEAWTVGTRDPLKSRWGVPLGAPPPPPPATQFPADFL
jgi:hypothetical protein